MLDKQELSNDGSEIIIGVIIALVVFIVFAVTYSVYIFIDLTHLSDAAGVHVVKPFRVAQKKMSGGMYSDEKKGIDNWFVYKDTENSFSIKYPSQWELGHEKNAVLLKSIDKRPGFESLIATIEAGRVEGKDRTLEESCEAIALTQVAVKKEMIRGREAVRIQLPGKENAIPLEMVCWQQNEKVYYIKAKFYTKEPAKSKEVFEKIITEFTVL